MYICRGAAEANIHLFHAEGIIIMDFQQKNLAIISLLLIGQHVPKIMSQVQQIRKGILNHVHVMFIKYFAAYFIHYSKNIGFVTIL